MLVMTESDCNGVVSVAEFSNHKIGGKYLILQDNAISCLIKTATA